MTNDWYGKKPVNAVPLTKAWYRAATTPRYTKNGEALYTFGPPDDVLPLGRKIGGIIVGLIAVILAALVLIGTAEAWWK